MSALDRSDLRSLNPGQLRALALMEVDVYQRRRVMRTPSGAATSGAVAAHGWSDAECLLPLARAVARAAGTGDVAAWRTAWLQSGRTLPDLAELRASPAAKRALWRQLRARQ